MADAIMPTSVMPKGVEHISPMDPLSPPPTNAHLCDAERGPVGSD